MSFCQYKRGKGAELTNQTQHRDTSSLFVSLQRETQNFYAVHLVCAGIANTSHKHHNVFSFLLLVISEWKIVILSFLFVTLFVWFGLVWLFCLFVFEADRRKVLH